MEENKYKVGIKNYLQTSSFAEEKWNTAAPGIQPHPFASICQKIADEGWESSAATEWIDNMHPLGAALAKALENHQASVIEAYNAEPDMVDPDDSGQSWKATWDENHPHSSNHPQYPVDPRTNPMPK